MRKILLPLLSVLLLTSCSNILNYLDKALFAAIDKDINSFSIMGVNGTIGVNTITLTVPYGTDLTNLTPDIGITGTNISPENGTSIDFTNPVQYTVTAADSSRKVYTVIVVAALSSSKDINAFAIDGVNGTIGVNTITLTVPYGTDLTNLTPTIGITGAGISPASGISRNFSSPVQYTVTAADSSTKVYTVTVTAALNPAKDITSFSIMGISGTIGVNTITLTVPYGTGLTSLTPTIGITGASISPISGNPQNFSSPVQYTVTAADSSTKVYTVTVTEALNPAKDITSFSIMGINGTIGVNTVALTVPYGTDLSDLTPTIGITGASISPVGGISQNFSSPVQYTVTAADSSTKVYTVTVTEALNPAKDITSFSIMGINGTIGVDTVTLTVPYGTNLADLTPVIGITGASISPVGGISRDFTNPVQYTVTAADSSTKVYTVTVTAALNPAKDITSFSIMGINGIIGVDTITLIVPYGTSLVNLTPTIGITGASISPVGGISRDFTNPVQYTVTAADSSTKVYTVTVTPQTLSTIVFADGTSVLKLPGYAAFTNAVSGVGTGTITYTSSNTGVATVNLSTGLVSIVSAGSSVITANKAADGIYSSAINSYTVYVLAIGQSFQGGIIAYILQSGDPGYNPNVPHGLIAATADQSAGIEWAIPDYQTTLVPGGTGTAIGTGSVNTDRIIAHIGAGTGYAAGIARAYNGGGYNDWYLPSYDELSKLHENMVTLGIGANYYWSSSEFNDYGFLAMGEGFYAGGPTPYDMKSALHYVRAVRSF